MTEIVDPLQVEQTMHAEGTTARAGELDNSWRIALVVTWILVVFAYSAVWKTSVELGIGTWWLGARSSPQPFVVRLLPFAVAVVFGLLSSSHIRRLPLINVGGALILALIAIPDFSRSVGLATIEMAIAGAVLLVALASFSGVVTSVVETDPAAVPADSAGVAELPDR